MDQSVSHVQACILILLYSRLFGSVYALYHFVHVINHLNPCQPPPPPEMDKIVLHKTFFIIPFFMKSAFSIMKKINYFEDYLRFVLTFNFSWPMADLCMKGICCACNFSQEFAVIRWAPSTKRINFSIVVACWSVSHEV